MCKKWESATLSVTLERSCPCEFFTGLIPFPSGSWCYSLLQRYSLLAVSRLLLRMFNPHRHVPLMMESQNLERLLLLLEEINNASCFHID